MTFVHSGTKLSEKQGSKGRTAFLFGFSARFVIFTSLCIKAPILPQRHFPPPSIFPTEFCCGHCHIHFATSPVIARTRPRIPLFLFSSNLVVPFQGKPREQVSSQDHLLHLIRRHLVAKSETAAKPPRGRAPCRFTPAHIPQMRHHKVLCPLRCEILLRLWRCLIFWEELHCGI